MLNIMMNREPNFLLQKQIENYDSEHEKPVNTQQIAIGDNDIITVALEKLKAELAEARFDTKQAYRNKAELIVLEHHEKEPSMDCWSDIKYDYNL